MKHGLSYILGLIALGVLGLAVSPAGADTIAAGPYYATPSWDQTLPASTRFIVLSNFSNAAVLDRETGLVWEKQPSAAVQTIWTAAGHYCITRAVGGRIGWRAPTVIEISCLFEGINNVFGQLVTVSLPAGHPFVIDPSVTSVWTATQALVLPGDSWSFNLQIGPDPRNQSTFLRNWCVRSASPGVDAL